MKNEERKHPVDELFSRKLRELESKPRPEAWTRLEGRLTHPPRRIVPAWVKYSAAASVLLIAGWWMVRPDAPSGAEVASVPSVKTAPAGRVEKPVEEVAQAATKAAQPESVVPEKTGRPAASHKEEKVRYQLEAVPRRTEMTAQPKRVLRPETPESRPVVQVTPEPVIRQEEVAVKPVESVKPLEAVKQPAAASLAKASEEKVFVVNVTAPDLGEAAGSEPDTTEKRPKGKFLARLAKGWKHIQDGEWSEVGLKKKGILARAEDNLFNKR